MVSTAALSLHLFAVRSRDQTRWPIRGASVGRSGLLAVPASCHLGSHSRPTLPSRGLGARCRAETGRGENTAGESRQSEARPSIRDLTTQERLALLELYTSGSDDDEGGSSAEKRKAVSAGSSSEVAAPPGSAQTVADKLSEQYKVVVMDEVTIPIGPRRKLVRRLEKPVTLAQKRNLRRAEYLEQASQRDDSTFYVIAASSVLLPPLVILAYAYSSGYLEFLQ